MLSRDDEAADRGDEVELVPAGVRGVVGDAAGHAREAQDVHREERQVEADEHQHELDLAQGLVEHPAGHLREPVVDAREDAEHRAAEQHVVEVRRRPSTCRGARSRRARRRENAPLMPPIRNIVRKPRANSSGVEKVSLPRHIVAIQLKNLTPVGTAIRNVISAEERQEHRAGREHVVRPHGEAEGADARPSRTRTPCSRTAACARRPAAPR